MIYAEFNTKEAEGTYLAHSIKGNSGRLGKGHKLSPQDVTDLQASGIDAVTAIRLEPFDVHEDAAAAQLGANVTGEGLNPSAAFTGRCNIHSTVHGVFAASPQNVDTLNSIDEAITLATLPPYSVVYPGQLVATAKIIPLAAPTAALNKTKGVVQISVHPFKEHKVGLVLTQLPQTKTQVLEKTTKVVNQRLKACDNELASTVVVEHNPVAIAGAIQDLEKAGHNLILIFGASAIVDRQDSLPQGLVKSGGVIEHFGMPVDPGNLLLLGSHNDSVVIGLPGCARSPKLNGFDWVLQRVLAGLKVSKNELTRMGCGGLLSEITTRPQPREKMPSKEETHHNKVTAILLAAGQSRRMGPENKLLQEWQGKPLVKWVSESLAASLVDNTIVVTGHEAGQVRNCLENTEVEFVHNPDYADGLSTSLIKGLLAVPADSDAILICLGDMPSINSAQLDQLIEAFDPENAAAICIPTFEGKRGNPVLWSRSFIPEMMSLKGDSGARHLLGSYPESLCEVAMNNTSILSDIDTPEALEALRSSEPTK